MAIASQADTISPVSTERFDEAATTKKAAGVIVEWLRERSRSEDMATEIMLRSIMDPR